MLDCMGRSLDIVIWFVVGEAQWLDGSAVNDGYIVLDKHLMGCSDWGIVLMYYGGSGVLALWQY